jgi:hypothetical protein
VTRRRIQTLQCYCKVLFPAIEFNINIDIIIILYVQIGKVPRVNPKTRFRRLVRMISSKGLHRDASALEKQQKPV